MSVTAWVLNAPLDLAVDVLSKRVEVAAAGAYINAMRNPSEEPDGELVTYYPGESPVALITGPTYPEPPRHLRYPDDAVDLMWGDQTLTAVFSAHQPRPSGRYRFRGLWYTYSDDPYDWMICGRRQIGWDGLDLSALRYNLPGDVDAICQTLDTLTEDEVARRVGDLLMREPGFEQPDPEKVKGMTLRPFRPWVMEQVQENVRLLRRLFERAHTSGGIVLHTLG